MEIMFTNLYKGDWYKKPSKKLLGKYFVVIITAIVIIIKIMIIDSKIYLIKHT